MTSEATVGTSVARTAPKPYIPSSWVGRLCKMCYRSGGDVIETSCMLVDCYEHGPVLVLCGERTIIAWGQIESITLTE